MILKKALVASIFVGSVLGQSQKYNGTILQFLNDTEVSHSIKIAGILMNSTDYASIIGILNDTSQNVTFFVPSDQVYYAATGEKPPLVAPHHNTTTTNTSSTTTTTNSSSTTHASSTTKSSNSSSKATSTSSHSSSASTHAAIAVPTHLAMMDYYAMLAKRYVRSFAAGLGWESLSTDKKYASQFNQTDLALYHLVNGTVNLNTTTQDVLVLDSLLNNQTVVKSGSYAPLVVQKQDGNWTVGTNVNEGGYISMNQTYETSNGIVYVIDKILIPPVSPSETLTEVRNLTLFDWVLSQANISLDDAVNITVFAPINQAMENMSLIGLTNESLTDFIGSHIIPGVYYSTNLTEDMFQTESVNGFSISIMNSTNQIKVNNATVVKPNILLNNGVMHLIDTVLVSEEESEEDPTQTTDIGPFPAPTPVN